MSVLVSKFLANVLLSTGPLIPLSNNSHTYPNHITLSNNSHMYILLSYHTSYTYPNHHLTPSLTYTYSIRITAYSNHITYPHNSHTYPNSQATHMPITSHHANSYIYPLTLSSKLYPCSGTCLRRPSNYWLR